jgi:hypothetical protein
MASNKVQELQLPVLDISNSDNETAKALVEAVTHYGFVFIKNNNAEIPPTDVTGMFDLVLLIQVIFV